MTGIENLVGVCVGGTPRERKGRVLSVTVYCPPPPQVCSVTVSPRTSSTAAQGWPQGWVPVPHPRGVDWDLVEAEEGEKPLEKEGGWVSVSQSGLSSKAAVPNLFGTRDRFYGRG